jgi:hypothetical protein
MGTPSVLALLPAARRHFLRIPSPLAPYALAKLVIDNIGPCAGKVSAPRAPAQRACGVA